MVQNLARRALIKNSGKTILALTGAAYLNGSLTHCATISFNEQVPVTYPKLGGNKIQPLEDGCFLGFMGCWERKPNDWRPEKDTFPELKMSTYKDQIGHNPAILTRDPVYSFMSLEYPGEFITKTHAENCIPLVYYSVKSAINEHGSLKRLLNNKKFIADTEKFAIKVANHKIPMFMCTMAELNGKWWPWGLQPNTAKELWRQIWQIFEDNGANDYATWMIEFYCPGGGSNRIDTPERYYPGDKYVDWIGLSAYARSPIPSTYKQFSSLVGPTYKGMRINHPEKPIMQAEFGVSRGSRQKRQGKSLGKDTSRQANWLKDAFLTIQSWPGMKAAIYSNQTTWVPGSGSGAHGDDHTLDPGGREIIRQFMGKGYFIGSN